MDKNGGVCEMVVDGQCGYLADVKNPEDLGAKVELALKNDHYKVLGENARQRALENFSEEAFINHFSQTYDALK